MTEQELRSILSANIKRYRARHNLSQTGLAEKLDISVNFLCNIENGNKWVSPQTMVRFATVLEIEPYELLKPDEGLSPGVSGLLSECLDEAALAVTQALNQVRGRYLPPPEAQAEG